MLCAANGRGGYRPAKAAEPALFIAKYSSGGLADMVANEATTLELCRVLLGDGEVATARLAPVDGLPGVALVVDRFDRAADAGKLRCEDFAQVVAQPPGLDHAGKYNVGWEAIGRALGHSSAPLLDARRVFKRLAAYVLAGNVDCHLKNWSLLETSDGPRLSPAYDVLNGYIYADVGYTTRFGLLVGDQRRHWQDYDRALLMDIAERIGLARRAAAGVLAELARRKAAFFARLGQGLRLGDERTWRYRASAQTAWERIHG